jgi:hypothetical protein
LAGHEAEFEAGEVVNPIFLVSEKLLAELKLWVFTGIRLRPAGPSYGKQARLAPVGRLSSPAAPSMPLYEMACSHPGPITTQGRQGEKPTEGKKREFKNE